ncbi:MAG: hypothetical protein F6J97_11935 [Leptolyngbya sp. SIO4C1]|nr:hypothetical protein [Leptolyngbya sp. SIO4C1]
MTANSTSPLRPLNVGNVVSAGLSLYRTHFKAYTGLSAKALLWYLVPIYGWAKAITIAGQIGRLGFRELIHQPEPLPTAYAQVQPRLWAFLGVTILVTLIQIVVNFAASIVGTLLLFPIMLLPSIVGEVGAALSSLLSVAMQILLLLVQLWFQARFMLYDLAIAVETDSEAVSSIGRSWRLTQGSAFRVQGVLLLSYLIMAPIYILTSIPLMFTFPLLARLSVGAPETEIASLAALVALAFLIFFILLLVAGIFTMPFYQSIKAVLYYDLRSRREGLDIQLADRGPADEPV